MNAIDGAIFQYYFDILNVIYKSIVLTGMMRMQLVTKSTHEIVIWKIFSSNFLSYSRYMIWHDFQFSRMSFSMISFIVSISYLGRKIFMHFLITIFVHTIGIYGSRYSHQFLCWESYLPFNINFIELIDNFFIYAYHYISIVLFLYKKHINVVLISLHMIKREM